LNRSIIRQYFGKMVKNTMITQGSELIIKTDQCRKVFHKCAFRLTLIFVGSSEHQSALTKVLALIPKH
jgi:hypothetical protein